ncbi:MAG: MFS transporter [Verrucomicrobia bacterium]|nr:MAG: MFS transporter [Verrucomicrobiota bacterium]
MNTANNAIAPNAQRLLWAGFTAILAAGLGFGIRGGIFANWAADFNFSATQLGLIGGAGFTSFCFGIIIGGLLVDKIGYGKLVAAAFALHVISALITFTANPSMPQGVSYQILFWGMFAFGAANGTLEAVANPMIATLFPNNRNHYLNILHASWPLGMIFGGLIGWSMGHYDWKIQLAFYLIPTLVYGAMYLGQKFPQSEASAKGLKLGEMLKDVGILGAAVVSGLLYLFFIGIFTPLLPDQEPLAKTLSAVIAGGMFLWIAAITGFALGHWVLFLLFIAHAMVGAVEIGTDSWIQNITGSILTVEQGKILFVITSLFMFVLRFMAHFIETKLGLKPVSLLFVCALLACLGLNLVSAVHAFGPAIGALMVYAFGKTFFWPTMLAVAGDRFPRTGAIAMSLMGGVGMMSAGLIGSPGLGYSKDRFAAQELKENHPALYQEWQSSEAKSKFFGFQEITPLDAKRLEEAKKIPVAKRTPEQQTVVAADIQANRTTLKIDSLIPASMAVIYLILMLYFKAIGGYRPLRVDEA